MDGLDIFNSLYINGDGALIRWPERRSKATRKLSITYLMIAKLILPAD